MNTAKFGGLTPAARSDGVRVDGLGLGGNVA
jgi:hypothetical protein